MSIRSLTSLAMAAALVAGVSAPAMAATPAETFSQGALSVQQDAGTRSVEETRMGLRLNTEFGDSVTIEGESAVWTDISGKVVATISLSAKGQPLEFEYDALLSVIRPKGPELFQNKTIGQAARGCFPKWVGWGYNVAWSGLVCVPLGVGVGAVATPIVGILTGEACGAAGGYLTTRYGC